MSPASDLPSDFVLFADFLSAPEADAALASLSDLTPWEDRHVHLFGREIPMPRRVCWYGAVAYGYSGTSHPPRQMPGPVDALRERVQGATGLTFNAALVNLYRDGRDSMGLHSDDDYEHGGQPCVASLSLGATRGLRLVERRPGGRRLTVALGHGSLLLMGEQAQLRWRHGLPRTARRVPPRVNLTFRYHLGPRL